VQDMEQLMFDRDTDGLGVSERGHASLEDPLQESNRSSLPRLVWTQHDHVIDPLGLLLLSLGLGTLTTRTHTHTLLCGEVQYEEM